jgi:ABC-type transport system involved in multi-copper enzyme maturation permease subunit
MKADSLRDKIDPLSGMDDINGVLIGLALWLLIIIAAPLIVLVLAGALLSIEIPIVVALGSLLALIRFTGLIPWTVVIVDQVTGEERREPYRNLWRAADRVRAINTDRRIKVRWAWS